MTDGRGGVALGLDRMRGCGQVRSRSTMLTLSTLQGKLARVPPISVIASRSKSQRGLISTVDRHSIPATLTELVKLAALSPFLVPTASFLSKLWFGGGVHSLKE